MSKTSLVIVLLEDTHHKMLIYRYLMECGLGTHNVRIERSPSGTGSAEGWVRKRFVEETSVYRGRAARTALIVMIDADIYSVKDRLRQLDQELTNKRQGTVGLNERIARLAPKRNVETWVLCLNGQTVNEETDYKNSTSKWSDLILNASTALRDWTRHAQELPPNAVSSLLIGVTELKRLELY